MEKIDLKKGLRAFYGPSAKEVVAVDVPSMNFLMIDGQGSPGDSLEYQEALAALFPVAYTLKFAVKKSETGIDFGVMPLEGLWWADDMNDFVAGNRDRWKWTLMIMQPDLVSAAMVDSAIDEVRSKKNPPGLDRVRFEPFAEGPAAQILHIGPFTDEGPAIEEVHRFIEDSGRSLSGKHHEIYLSDIRRARPERLRTVIRQPFSG